MNHAKKGFTLIELMLAMAFIAMLLLAIAMIVVQISQIYNRGLTLKELDQASRTISADISQDVVGAAAFSLDAASQHYVTQPWGGSLCLGRYSYVWNFGKAIDTYNRTGQANAINLIQDAGGAKTVFNIVKVLDVGRSMCANATAKTVPADGSTELLQTTDHDLAVHEFCTTTQPTALDTLTGQQLYTVTFALGTNDGDALKAAPVPGCTGPNEHDGLLACKSPGESGADLTYCTVQEFSLVVRAQNAVN